MNNTQEICLRDYLPSAEKILGFTLNRVRYSDHVKQNVISFVKQTMQYENLSLHLSVMRASKIPGWPCYATVLRWCRPNTIKHRTVGNPHRIKYVASDWYQDFYLSNNFGLK